jgi:PAS domain S-box-containing protein
MTDGPSILSSLESLPALAVLEGLARLHQAVFAADSDGRMLWISQGLGALRGTSEWRAGESGHDYFVRPGQLDEIRARFAALGQLHGERAELRGPHGEAIPVEIDGVRIRSLEPARPLFIGIVRPLAEREKRDEELRETAAFLSAILENSPVAVLAVDGRGFITYANPAVRGALGHEPAALLEKPVAMLAGSPEELAGAILGADPMPRGEIELRHADGSPRHTSVAASELRLADGRTLGSVVLLHDHTEQRRVENELRRKNGELEHYVQNVTHDLRSPLVSLLGFSRLLRQEYSDRMDDTARHFLDRIEKAGHTMEALISDLLELSRIDSPRDHKAYVNVSDVLSQLQAELKPRLESQGVQLRLPAEPVVVLCDRTRLYQVFSNLVGNALDYMGPVSNPEIAIEVYEEPGEHRIVVRDNGRGIEPAQRERIFELFQSCGPRADGRRGTGIGLAIVKKIAQSQGGRVWVESRPGEGAAFHVTLPRS